MASEKQYIHWFLSPFGGGGGARISFTPASRTAANHHLKGLLMVFLCNGGG